MKIKTLRRALYRRTRERETAMRNNSIAWFSYKRGYGSDESYGAHISKWKPTSRPLRLLDIGSEATRAELAHILFPEWPRAKCVEEARSGIFSCNEQYSGGAANLEFHRLIKPVIEAKRLDGTVIVDRSADEECKGPTEVVLYIPKRAKLVRKVVN